MTYVNANDYRQLELHSSDSSKQAIPDILSIEDGNGNIIWRKQYYVAFLDYNDYTISVDIPDVDYHDHQFVYHNEAAVLPKEVPSYVVDGITYIFDGWDKPTDHIVSDETDSRYRLYVLIHAKYVAIKPFDVQVDGNTGTANANKISVTYGQQYPTGLSAEKPGCELAGWSLRRCKINEYEQSDLIDMSDVCQLRHPTTIYAVWRI